MNHRRKFIRNGFLFVSIVSTGFVSMTQQAFAKILSSPGFSAKDINDVLMFYFDTVEAEDDASILITAPIKTQNKALVPFKIEAPGAEKIVLVSDANPEPVIMTMEQVGDSRGVMIGRMRLLKTGTLTCYVLRNEKVRRGSLKITVSGHW